MICSKCNRQVPEGSRFCNSCGASLEEPSRKETSPEVAFDAPQWYQALFDDRGNPRVLDPPEGVRRLEFGVLGKQPHKWLSELQSGDKVRILYAEGQVYHRAPRPWERSDAPRLRYPWTVMKEGALLLIVGSRQFRYADIKNEWVEATGREQVYVGVEDSHHKDNSGRYLGLIEVAPAASQAR